MYVCIYHVCVTGWLSYVEFFMPSQILLTCEMPSDTPDNITGHTDPLLSSEMSMHEI